MITVAQAMACYARHIQPLAVCTTALGEATNTCLAAAAHASVDLPPFAQSAMDGYALRAAWTQAATPDHLITLPLTGASHPGHRPPALGESAAAIRILTGAPLPQGADAIVPQENVIRGESTITLHQPARPGSHIRRRAEELQAGTLLAEAGIRLTPALQAALAAAGIAEVAVHRHPRVWLLVTGDELCAPGQPRGTFQVYDAATTLVQGWLASQGLTLAGWRHVPDNLEQLTAAMDEALGQADWVLTTGGASVGDRDHLKAALQRCGLTMHFGAVAQKPGKPLVFAQRMHGAGPILLGLPGNPAAMLVCLATHGRMIAAHLAGASDQTVAFWQHGLLTRDITPVPGKTWWLRVQAKSEPHGLITLEPLPGQASHMLGNAARANALACIPPGERILPAGTVVPYVGLA